MTWGFVAVGVGTAIYGGATAYSASQGGPDLPQYPGLTPEEQKILKSQNMSVDQLNEIVSGNADTVKANRELLKGISGIFDESGNVNQGALKSLQDRTRQQLDQQEAIGQKGMDYLSQFFSNAAGPMTAEITKAAQDRYLRALKGELPVTLATQDQAKKDFEQLKEAAGQRGIRIDGDTFDSATSESTAGIRLIGEFKKNYNLKVEGERQAELQTGAQTLGTLSSIATSNLNAVGSIGQIAAGVRSPQLGILGSLETSGTSLIPQIQAVSGQQGNILNFLRSIDVGQFQQQTQQELYDYQHEQGILNSISQFGGTVAGFGLANKFYPSTTNQPKAA